MTIYRNLYAGLGAGALAAIIAVLVSLPLESPDDIVLNAGSVGFGALVVGAANGILWHFSASDSKFNKRYIVLSAVLFVVIIAVASLAQTQFDDAVSFTIPLAVTISLLTILGTPILATNDRLGIWFSGILVFVAIVLSFALAGQGDQESGSLSLPPAP
jgi:uncharacterized membrane protein